MIKYICDVCGMEVPDKIHLSKEEILNPKSGDKFMVDMCPDCHLEMLIEINKLKYKFIKEGNVHV